MLLQLQVDKKFKSGKTSINKLESWVNQLQHKKRDFKHDHIQSAKIRSISTQIKENEDELKINSILICSTSYTNNICTCILFYND